MAIAVLRFESNDEFINAEIGIQSGNNNYWGIYHANDTDDLRFWHEDDRLVITDDGIKEWYKDGKFHREDGPAIEEERRLAYVGITRAQDELTLSMALARRKWGKDQAQHPSRFLFELIGQADNPHEVAHTIRSRSTQV